MENQVVCFGELLLRLAAPGRELLLQSPRLHVQVGGAEANVAVSLAVLGHATALVSTVADNALGHAAVGELRRHGVDTRHVRMREGRMGLYFLTHGAMQRPSEVLYDRAGSAFTADADYDWDALLEGAAWLHLSGVSPALCKTTADATLAAATAARRRGVRVSFDGNFRSKLWQAWSGDPAPILRDIFAQADLLFADHRDIAVVLGGDAHASSFETAAAQAFEAFGHLRWIAATTREQHSVDAHRLSAALIERAGTRHEAPGYEMHGIVDRIGGGDAFAAGVLHGLITGMPLQRTVHYGLAASCLKHSIAGDFNLATDQQIEALISDSGFHVRR